MLYSDIYLCRYLIGCKNMTMWDYHVSIKWLKNLYTFSFNSACDIIACKMLWPWFTFSTANIDNIFIYKLLLQDLKFHRCWSHQNLEGCDTAYFSALRTLITSSFWDLSLQKQMVSINISLDIYSPDSFHCNYIVMV